MKTVTVLSLSLLTLAGIIEAGFIENIARVPQRAVEATATIAEDIVTAPTEVVKDVVTAPAKVVGAIPEEPVEGKEIVKQPATVQSEEPRPVISHAEEQKPAIEEPTKKMEIDEEIESDEVQTPTKELAY